MLIKNYLRLSKDEMDWQYCTECVKDITYDDGERLNVKVLNSGSSTKILQWVQSYWLASLLMTFA